MPCTGAGAPSKQQITTLRLHNNEIKKIAFEFFSS
jgi:hypothetical protein